MTTAEILLKLQQKGLYDGITIHKRIEYRLKKHDVLLFTAIIDHTDFLVNPKFRERIYCLEHNITEPKMCEYCKSKRVKFLSNKKQYAQFCSVQCATNSPAVKKRKVQTCIDRFGTDNPSKHNDIKLKKQQTMIANYGEDTITGIDEANNRRKQTNLRKYGHENPFGSPIIQQQIRDQNLLKYGTHYIGSRLLSKTQLARLNDSTWLHEQHVVLHKHIKTIALELDVDPTTVSNYCTKANIQIQNFTFSTLELDIVNEIKRIYGGEIITNTRAVISPFELDIWLPELNVAIEFCGLYWHSSRFKTKNYHFDKYCKCKELGITLITIFEDEMTLTKDIVFSRIASIIGTQTQTSYMARKCTTKELTSSDKRKFLDKNHIQGNGRGSISYGLYCEDDLLSCITFIREQRDVYVLNRFCSKINTNVVGGFGKLLSHFKHHNNWQQIVTFADNRWSVGNVYQQLGFIQTTLIPPDYYYIVNDKRIHKFNFRHKQLKYKLANYDESLSETQNMLNHNIHRIWDCGKIKFVLNH